MMTEQKQLAAILVAQDRLKNKEIAEKVGIAPRTLDNWKTEPDFKQAVQQYLDSVFADIHRKGIADKRRRIYQLNDRWRRYLAIVQAYAKDPELRKFKGGNSGFLRKRVRAIPIGDGLYDQITEVFFDAKLAAALNRVEEQAARELGQWDDKPERIIRRLADLSKEEVDALLADIERQHGIRITEPHAGPNPPMVQ